jgi:hypothetical protein
MTVQEIMERAGIKETGLAIAWIKDAIHLIDSQYGEHIANWKTDISDGTREYPFPANMIKLESISVKDTNDDKWKKIRRLTSGSVVSEDNSPE